MPDAGGGRIHHVRRASGVAAGVVAVAASWVVAALYGVSSADIARYLLASLWSILLPGALVHRALRGRSRDLLSEVTWAFVVGLVVQLVAWAIFVGLGVGGWLAAYPLIVLAVFAAVPALRVHLRPGRYESSTPVPVAWGLTAAYVVSIGLLAYGTFRVSPLPPSTRRWYQDLYWHAAISADARHSVPPVVPQLGDQTLKYHWFSNAHMAADSLVSGVDVLTVTARLWYLPIYAALTATTYLLAAHLTRRAWAGLLAAVLILVPPGFLLLQWLPGIAQDSYIPLSPSQMFSLPLIALTVWLLIDVCRARASAGTWVLFVFLAIGLSGAKSSSLPTVLGGAGLALLLSLVRRTGRTAAACATAAVAVVIAVSSRFVAGGTSGSTFRPDSTVRSLKVFQQFSSHSHLQHRALAMLLLVLIVLQVGYGLVGLFLLRRPHIADPGVWILIGVEVAAQIALSVIDHPQGSQFYFVRGTDPLWTVFGVWGFAAVVARARPAARWRIVTAAAGFGVLGTLLVAVARILGGEHQPTASAKRTAAVVLLVGLVVVGIAFLLRLIRRRPVLHRVLIAGVAGGVLIASTLPTLLTVGHYAQSTRSRTPPYDGHLATAQVAGARWVAAHTPQDDLIATNIYCVGTVTVPHCDDRAYWVQGLTERNSYLGGWAYEDQNQANVLHDPHTAYRRSFWDPARLRLNAAAFSAPTPEVLDTLYGKGVRYLFADTTASQVSSRLRTLADLVWSSGQVQVYKLHAPA
ncbi:hypothetical protein [Allobranchiibius sp. GilTou38]|uniref:hypothetical protein n=1 Tax=Allobranchiibius sp. GilTou38 TaxID=2815210 RepID=UPI001AA0CCB1|nr:hypothetical protein [Allobranchiibius sp. GilTou38]MBO1765420.1 hypothetical protein [Allobranchiibius sp. GilTou38]